MGKNTSENIDGINEPTKTVHKCRPALTPEARQSQLVSLAFDLLEERLRNGTATSQEVTTLIKLGSTRERIEEERLLAENELSRAKIRQIQADQQSESIAKEAIKAMKEYKGLEVVEEDGEVCVDDDDNY